MRKDSPSSLSSTLKYTAGENRNYRSLSSRNKIVEMMGHLNSDLRQPLHILFSASGERNHHKEGELAGHSTMDCENEGGSKEDG